LPRRSPRSGAARWLNGQVLCVDGVLACVGSPPGSRSLVNLVAEGKVDVAVMGRLDRRPLIRLGPLYCNELMVFCFPAHPLAQARHVEPEDLVSESVIGLPRG
jgi:DNA-binding transcriptional LysR family regulator